MNLIRIFCDGGTASEKGGILLVRYLIKSLLELRSHSKRDIKYLEFLFVFYIDDLIRMAHDWDLFE